MTVIILFPKTEEKVVDPVSVLIYKLEWPSVIAKEYFKKSP